MQGTLNFACLRIGASPVALKWTTTAKKNGSGFRQTKKTNPRIYNFWGFSLFAVSPLRSEVGDSAAMDTERSIEIDRGSFLEIRPANSVDPGQPECDPTELSHPNPSEEYLGLQNPTQIRVMRFDPNQIRIRLMDDWSKTDPKFNF